MYFDFNTDSSILFFFFAQGIIFSFLLLKKGIQDKDVSSRWLSFFVFLCTLYISPWVAGHGNWYAVQPYQDILFYVPTQLVFWIGPVIWTYTQSLLNRSFKLTRRHLLHFLPGLIYLIYALVIFLVDKVILQEYYFYADGRDKDLDKWYQISGLISMVIYFLLSLQYYTRYEKLTVNLLSFADQVRFKWVRQYLVAFLIMQVLRVVFLWLYPEWGSFGNKWWYYLCFAILYSYIALTGYANTVKSAIAIRLSGEEGQILSGIESERDSFKKSPSTESGSRESQAGEKGSIEEDSGGHALSGNDSEQNSSGQNSMENPELKPEILDLIAHQEFYRNPLLTLGDLADSLGTNTRTVSRAINQGFGMNFNDLVNHYRVEAVKRCFSNGDHEKITLLAIAFECGFNSKTTFNRAFKKHASLSPKTYLEEMKSNPGV